MKKPYENKESSKRNRDTIIEKKGYKKLTNEIIPIQQAEAYRKPTKKIIEEAVKELNPDSDSMESRG